MERGIVCGYLHVHLLFSRLTVTTPRGEEIRVIERGHLTALDDPDVCDLAARHGDPDTLLREDWIPDIPGISASGRYNEYARDPAACTYRGLRAL